MSAVFTFGNSINNLHMAMCAIGGYDGFHVGNDRFAIGVSRGRSSGQPKNEQPHTIKDGDC